MKTTLQIFGAAAALLVLFSFGIGLAQQQNTAPFTSPFAIYASALPTTGCNTTSIPGGIAFAVLLSAPSLNYTTSTGGSCTWTAVGGSSGPFINSQGNTGAITMTGSDVTIWSVTGVSALATGSCYQIDFTILDNTAGGFTHGYLKVDGTIVSDLLGGAGSAGFYQAFHFSYCNNVGSQAAQTMVQGNSGYCGVSSNCAGGSYTGSVTPIGILSTPTAVNWATTHTVSFTLAAASGNMTGLAWRFGQ